MTPRPPPGWLPALLEPFEDDRVGAVGPKVVFPDGRLQEAGAAINTDGSSSMIGLFDDATLPRYNYVRRVDYVSAVCLAIERDRFREMNGFSTEFAPAYYEDVDLCLRLTKRGLHVVYTPRATVVHHLSVTSDSLDSEFKIRCVTRNQQRLSERHQEYIDALNDVRLIAFYLPQFHPIPENDALVGARVHRMAQRRRGARPDFAGHDQPRAPGRPRLLRPARPRGATAQQVQLGRALRHRRVLLLPLLVRRPAAARAAVRAAAAHRTAPDFPFCSGLGQRELDAAVGRTRARHAGRSSRTATTTTAP